MQFGGTIELESEIGQGSTFTFSFELEKVSDDVDRYYYMSRRPSIMGDNHKNKMLQFEWKPASNPQSEPVRYIKNLDQDITDPKCI